MGYKRMILAAAMIGWTVAPTAAQTPATLPPPPPLSNATAPRHLTASDVLSMSRSGLSEAVIIESVRQQRMAFAPSSNDLISLRQAGVSNAVLEAMLQSAPLPPQASAASSPVYVQQASPVVIERPIRVYSPPVIYRSYPSYWDCHHGHHHHYHSRPRHSGSWGIHVRF